MRVKVNLVFCIKNLLLKKKDYLPAFRTEESVTFMPLSFDPFDATMDIGFMVDGIVGCKGLMEVRALPALSWL